MTSPTFVVPSNINIPCVGVDLDSSVLMKLCVSAQTDEPIRLGAYIAMLKKEGLSQGSLNVTLELIKHGGSDSIRATVFHTISGGLLIGALEKPAIMLAAPLLEIIREEQLPVLLPMAAALLFQLGDNEPLRMRSKWEKMISDGCHGRVGRHALSAFRTVVVEIKHGTLTKVPIF